MISGILLKGYSGFYYVFAEGRVWECSLRGRFRIRNQEFLPGDRVKILPGTGIKATIEEVEPRRNSLVRPTIANVDQAFLVFAYVSPEPDLNLLDRLIIQVTDAQIKPVIIMNKLDLASTQADPSGKTIAADGMDFYRELGYDLIKVSTKTREGLVELQEQINGKVTVLAGPSGVGKSSLLNALSPDLELKTGDVSQKLKRGRHTTRHVELMVCGEGLLADTPGFSSLYLPEMKREELTDYFVEFRGAVGKCRFANCMHHKEPDCAVKAAVASGMIHPSRYEHYGQFLEEVIAAERRY
ncbi:ribosome small subunit-dependent GTPase A [Desulfitobacterium dichloroeliminans LMG P-21439]|uniref:Small ribosomal subunit biogenesis GTPase RsgA n=1 Tax=Desulfitobacterium dichloroeliminans (strain LMG P-21439 / DCA1) TaxID=871963 RepID=L0F8J7_DESDL|nr:ribosome small subunit-dependent GTPase A [Desulfitobacterium dichloroeliminans]AGA70144.1 ribosome small subunit-dependent GTPase A [Desulfitobacterium dichloroeliminans LMG P-21439]